MRLWAEILIWLYLKGLGRENWNIEAWKIKPYKTTHAPAIIYWLTCCLSACILVLVSATRCCSPLTLFARISLAAVRCWRSRSNMSFDAFSCASCFFSCSALSRSHCDIRRTYNIMPDAIVTCRTHVNISIDVCNCNFLCSILHRAIGFRPKLLVMFCAKMLQNFVAGSRTT